ncbi:MAG: DEAD/DEAH box helicase, partial [Desulfovibrionaceae bacterium]|nr:DEAD/DEAH box helicase [Desulfovibrionaceae bacterium]
MSDTREYLEALLARGDLVRQITGHKILQEQPARYAETRRPLSRVLQEVLKSLHIPGLYTHQAEAVDRIRAGQDVVVTTPTASGKTLVYNLPFLEKRLQDPDATAIYLFPLKALAQDQKKALEGLTLHWPEHARPPVALYDGDTPDHVRAKIRRNPPAVLITNPEMLHLGILPNHERWTTFLASLSMIVLDEAHIYRGVFGAHMAGVLRRLDRLCARYNAHPVHVLCTATLGNPGQLGQLLLGLDREPPVVSQSGAPRGRRHMIFMEPENSPSTLAIQLLRSALKRELRTIVYCRSRRMTELVSMWVSQQSQAIASRVSAYRAGYLPEERREIEARMASGDLLAVISTSALELGIDIGALDVCILVGYPGSIMATLQRGGRVGRKGQESLVFLLGGEDALDQYFVRNPDEFFNRPPESAMLNPDNPVILARHLECAAAESMLRHSEKWTGTAQARQTIGDLERQGLLLESADGQGWLAARKKPQRQVSLRGSGESYQIVDGEGTVIGSVDAHQAFRETHPGAVYLHHGKSYTIKELDMGARKAVAVPERVRWHTNVRTSKTTEIVETVCEGQVYGMKVCFGRLRVTEQITGYERRDNGTR